jgi:hypothetical protein
VSLSCPYFLLYGLVRLAGLISPAGLAAFKLEIDVCVCWLPSCADARVHGAVLGWLGRAKPVPPAQQADNCGRNTLRFGSDSLATCNPGAGQSFHRIVLEEIAIVKED